MLTAPLCRIPESATPDAESYDVDPMNRPAGRLRACLKSLTPARFASAFGYVHDGVISLSPFAFTLPAGWTVSPDPTRSNGWVNGWAGNGSHVLRLRSADGTSGVDLVTAPSPSQVINSDPVTPMHAYSARPLVSREARGLADWTRAQPWIRAEPAVPSSVGGLPAWTVDTGPRSGADTEAERGTCIWEAAGCLLFSSYHVQGDHFGGKGAYLRPGTSRLVYFDAPPAPDESGSASVVAVLWDQRTTPAGRDHIITTVQPIIDSIRFPGATPTP